MKERDYSKKQVIEMMNHYGEFRYLQGRNDEILNPSDDVEVIKETSRLVFEALNNFDKFVPLEIRREIRIQRRRDFEGWKYTHKSVKP